MVALLIVIIFTIPISNGVSHSVIPILCNPMDCNPPGCSVYEILQARILPWVAIPSPGDLPNPGIKPESPALQADSLPFEPPGICLRLPCTLQILLTQTPLLLGLAPVLYKGQGWVPHWVEAVI